MKVGARRVVRTILLALGAVPCIALAQQSPLQWNWPKPGGTAPSLAPAPRPPMPVGLVEGEFYRTSVPTVTCLGPGNCINIPAGEIVRVLKADIGGGQAFVTEQLFPTAGTNMLRTEIGPHVICRHVVHHSTEPYMPIERSVLECIPDAAK